MKEDYKTHSLKEMLTRIYDCHQHDAEGDKRSTRFANKLRSRAWGPKVKRQTRESRDIIDLLHVDKKKVLNDYNTKKQFSESMFCVRINTFSELSY